MCESTRAARHREGFYDRVNNKEKHIIPALSALDGRVVNASHQLALITSLPFVHTDVLGRTRATCWNWIIGTGWNGNSGNNRVRCSPDWSVYRCIERYCMMPRQRDDDNNLSVGNRNHLKLGIEPESWLQSHELGF